MPGDTGPRGDAGSPRTGPTLSEPSGTVIATTIGASRPAQLADNVAALDVRFSAGQLQALDAASALPPTFPYGIFTPQVKRMVFGGHEVQGW